MPMPHAIQKQKILERLKNLEGKAKVKEIQKILEEISQYKSGPYGEMRSWLAEQIEKTRVKRKIKAADSFAVKKEGQFQVGFIGQPSTGKSSIIKALSGAQIKVAEYAFTTLKPQPAIIQIYGIDFQLLDLPGLIEAASQGKGLGKRILSVIHNVDGLLFVHDITKPTDELKQIIIELKKSGITPLKDKPAVIVANKTDLIQDEQKIVEMQKEFNEYKIVAVSAKENKNLELLKEAIWSLSGFIKVYSKGDLSKPVALQKEATVKDFAKKIHKEFVEKFKYAKITGPSAKFAEQKVGLNHKLQDNDIVEIAINAT